MSLFFVQLKQKTYIVAFAYLFFMSIFAAVAHADEPEDVFWAGLSFLASDNASTAPVAEILRTCSTKPNKICGGPNLDISEVARDYFLTESFSKINLKNERISAGTGLSYILSPTITTEMVLEADQGYLGYSYTFIISGNVFVLQLDGLDNNYVHSLPVTVLLEEYYDTQLSKTEQQQYIADLYLNDKREGINFFKKMAQKAAELAQVNVEFTNPPRISKVEFSDEVRDILVQTRDIEAWRKTITSFTEGRLADWSEKPIIPASLGLAPQLIFENGLRTITLPISSYDFEIDIRRFMKDTPETGVVCFMVGTILSVIEIDAIILKAPFFHTQDGCIDIPSGVKRDPSVFFPMNLFGQLDKITKLFNGESGATYIKKSAPKNATEIQQNIKLVYSKAFGEN